MSGRLGAVSPQAPRLLAGVRPGGPVSLEAHQRQWGPLPTRADAGPDRRLIDLVDASGLLGRGGAGFPTGRKMRTVAAASKVPVVVANGCEGEPASGKDTLLLSCAPHLVLDGIQLAAQAVGADEAHLVIHRGAAHAETVRAACAERGGIDHTAVTVHETPARYVASEETALVHWLNGGDAKPTFTPPRPYEQGVSRRPTLINNVETLAHVAAIARYGAEWFRTVGDPDEPGTLLVTALGDGVLEVPTGTAIGAITDRQGGRTDSPTGVLIGGYFGTWLPLAYARQLPLTHRALGSAGSALGAGVLAVLPGDRCGLAETARVIGYLAGSTAGQCGPCINGLPSLAAAMQALAHGPWDDRWWPATERWLAVIPGRGACRHPDGATRLVGSALNVFAEDVARHRAGHPCDQTAAPAWLPIPAPAPTSAGWR